MDIVARTVILGIVGAVMCLVIKKGSPEISLVLAIAVSFLVLAFAIEIITAILEFMEVIRDAAELSPVVMGPVVRTVGISILTRLAADTCKDAGQAGIASAVELAGTVAAIYVALPLMRTVFDMVGRLL